MDEQQIQIKRNEEENSTQMRAGVLGLKYYDMRPVENDMPLYKDVLTVEEIRAEQAIW